MRADAITKINERIGSIEKDFSKSGILGLESSVNRAQSAESYANYLRTTYSNEAVTLSDGTQTTVGKLLELRPGEGYQNGTYTYDQLKNIEINILSKNNPGASTSLKAKSEAALRDTARQIGENRELYNQVLEANKLSNIGLGRASVLGARGQKTIYSDVIPLSNVKFNAS